MLPYPFGKEKNPKVQELMEGLLHDVVHDYKGPHNFLLDGFVERHSN